MNRIYYHLVMEVFNKKTYQHLVIELSNKTGVSTSCDGVNQWEEFINI